MTYTYNEEKITIIKYLCDCSNAMKSLSQKIIFKIEKENVIWEIILLIYEFIYEKFSLIQGAKLESFKRQL